MAKYRITQDRWCWCGRSAGLIVVKGEALVEPVCSEEHGQITIDQLLRKEKRVKARGEKVGTGREGTD